VRLFPTRPALDLALAAASVVLVGILLFQPAIVAWGGALMTGLALARAITLLNVARVRTAGFEMVWRNGGRSARVAKGQTLELFAEVRNRDTRAVRFAASRVVASSNVAIEVTPAAGEVPAGGRLDVVRVDASLGADQARKAGGVVARTGADVGDNRSALDLEQPQRELGVLFALALVALEPGRSRCAHRQRELSAGERVNARRLRAERQRQRSEEEREKGAFHLV